MEEDGGIEMTNISICILPKNQNINIFTFKY